MLRRRLFFFRENEEGHYDDLSDLEAGLKETTTHNASVSADNTNRNLDQTKVIIKILTTITLLIIIIILFI